MTWLNDMRILAALAIIFVHVSQASLNMPDTINSTAWWVSNFYLSFSLWGVPIFVMISGALLLSPQRNYPTLSSFYQKRINRLLIPLLFWTCFYLLWSFLKSTALGKNFELEKMLVDLLSGRPYYHMWYLYMVFGLYLFTPYLRKIVQHSTDREVLILSIILLSISVISVATHTSPHHATVFIQLFPLYLGYFFAGHLIFKTEIKIKNLYLVILFVFFALMTALGHYIESLYFQSNYFYQNFSITVLPMSIFLMFLIKHVHQRIPINPTIREGLAVFSLGAYLIHPAVFDIIKKLHYFGIDQETSTWATIPFNVLIITLISLFIAYIFSKLPYMKRII